MGNGDYECVGAISKDGFSYFRVGYQWFESNQYTEIRKTEVNNIEVAIYDRKDMEGLANSENFFYQEKDLEKLRNKTEQRKEHNREDRHLNTEKRKEHDNKRKEHNKKERHLDTEKR